ncbi:hypothetical protein BZA70DRAFT_180424 [Myxozyma melibiosi]|uniref:Peptidase M20 dimerisation domain-containing protein n=1 Tax=Myxozyma melibiosi TaxID=54550 RepID=A0ABR1F4C1_9ASCO
MNAQIRQLLRHYSEVYTVFLPLFGIFTIIYICIHVFAGSDSGYVPGSPGALPDVGDADSTLEYLHKSLISIPSITKDEHAASMFLQSYLTSTGWTVEVQEVSGTPLRENIYAYRGSARQTKVLLTSHVDTVPPYIPYSVHDGLIWGRGSVDAKASIAAQITAAQSLLSEGLVEEEGDISLLFVVGEEADGIGMITANELGVTWESAIFGEPTELKLAKGHKGMLMADLYSKGLASHSGYPELGINANYFLIEALYALQHTDFPASDLLGNTTFNAGKISGGVAPNVIAANATAALLLRVAADMDVVITKLRAAVDAVEHLELDITLTYDPVVCDYAVPGFDTTVAAYGTDIPHLRGDHKKYLYGPGSILYAHADNERVGLDELKDSVVGFKKLVTYSLGAEEDSAESESESAEKPKLVQQ